ncbi:hypothetical protein [Paenibacillus sinopodophylli]|uniref:hypothetical protein n=1 Tax=Paenibacillus sinopodophylli TaxID=1837342 RepID=UPI001FEAB34F|nr:hypothetical protein [Paenibacillus sinopodophylli]
MKGLMIMPKSCLPCNAYFDGEICERCFDPVADYVEVIEVYKGKEIKKYSYDTGFRVDFGAKRSKMVTSIQEARELIDYR